MTLIPSTLWNRLVIADLNGGVDAYDIVTFVAGWFSSWIVTAREPY